LGAIAVVSPHRMIQRGGVTHINKSVYWDSPEAAKLFGFNEGEDVYSKLEERVTLLKGSLQKPDGYKSILQHSEETLTADQVFKIRNKCVFLIRAYQIALEKLGTNNTRWKKDCCQEAVNQINEIGFDTTINANTLMNWNIDFRKYNQFHHPDIYVANNIKPKPALFENFPQAAVDASLKILNNLDHFNVEMLRVELINTIIPSLKEEIEVTGDANANIDGYNLLCHYMAKPPSYTTVLRWVHYLGFKQDSFKKSYYVDGHEHPSQIAHRNKFTDEYLTNLEPRSHRWVQIPKDVYVALIASLPTKPLVRGYEYENEMIEFHVDDHECLQEYATHLWPEFGGTHSVRRPENSRPLIIFGQDESVFSQFSFNGKQWVGPSGERSILPKNDGIGVMVSAFQSREFGWGVDITEEQMVRINEMRNGKEYFDIVAANEVNGKALKPALTTSPFIHLFQFGGRNGYWTGNHMILQTEDCIDCLKVILDERYEFAFLFDHSSGHAKKRSHGLDVRSMNKGFGGELLRNSKIEEVNGFLGPFHDPLNPRMITVGQEQTFGYTSPNDIAYGPFYLTNAEMETKRKDQLVSLDNDKDKDKSKAELVADLMETEWGKAEGKIVISKMLVRDLRSKATLLGIETHKRVTHRVVPGWEGKGKGLLQILWERGWIDESKLKEYKVRVTDDAGIIIPEYSLTTLMENCTDFKNEMTQLEFVCHSLSCKALITTKYHAEFAGEGIEYSWGFSKALYRKYPLESKKGKQNFDALVSKCISRDVLKKDQVRRFCKRARSYMLTYKSLELSDKNNNEDGIVNNVTLTKIENMKKVLKSHRAALDFDKSFIMSSITADDFNFEEIEFVGVKRGRGQKRGRPGGAS